MNDPLLLTTETPAEHSEDYTRARAEMSTDVDEIIESIEALLRERAKRYPIGANRLYEDAPTVMRDLVIERLQDLG